ncbi:MAG: MFS transporter [Acidobacteriota bacterium]
MKYRHRVLAMLFLLSIITYIDRVCISVAGPAMQKDLDISPEMWGWVVGVFAISYAAFEIPSGAMGDRIGARKVLTRIVIWWSAFTSLTGAVSKYWLLLLVRFMFGAGEAGAYPNSSSSISRWFPVAERARAHGFVWMASRIGGAVSPLLVIPIQVRWGWRASFWAFGFLGVIWALFWYRWYRDAPREKRGVSQAEIEEIEGAGGAPARRHHGLPWRKVLRKGNFWTILLMYHTYCWGSYFFLSWLHTYLAKGRGYTNDELQFWSPLPFICGALANFSGGFASDHLIKKLGLKWGRRTVAMTGLGASACFMLATALVRHKIAAVILLSLAYAGSDFMLPVAWAVCLDVGRKYAGAMTGAMNTAGQVGSFLSSVAFGYLVRWFGSYNAPLFPMAGMLAISTLLWLRIDPTEEMVPEARERGPEAAGHV